MSKSRKRRQRAQLRARAKSSHNPATRSLRYEPLEDRRMLAVVTVDTEQDVVDFNDGLTSLREAIFATNLVEGPDEIVFDFGHDGPATILLTEGELAITDSLTITGSGAELLTIDAGNGADHIFGTGDGHRIFIIDDGDNLNKLEVGISELTLTGGDTVGISASSSEGAISGFGGAILSFENLSIDSAVIKENAASGAGGGIYQHSFGDSNVSISSTTFSENTTLNVGGGLYIVQSGASTGTILDSVFSKNTSTTRGGGIFVFLFGSSSMVIEDNVITENMLSHAHPNLGGGGLFAFTRDSSSMHIVSSTISNNTTKVGFSSSGIGGGVNLQQFDSSSVFIESTIISENSAHLVGGIDAHLLDESSLTIVSSTISKNAANGSVGGAHVRTEGLSKVLIGTSVISENITSGMGGGGIWASTSGSSELTIDSTAIYSNTSNQGNGAGLYARTFSDSKIFVISSTISGNIAQDTGGGILAQNYDNSLLRISNSTITDNRSAVNNLNRGIGGGIYVEKGAVELNHTIVARNFDQSGTVHDIGGEANIHSSLIGDNAGTSFSEAPVGSPDANGNLIGGPVHGIIDPLLAPLADNGGPTLTHALLPGSPAINAGDLNAVAGVDGAPLFDQRGEGFDRILSRIDIGAYEVQELGDLNLLVDTLVDESDGDFSRGDLSLREAIELANANPVPDTIRFDPIFTAIAGPLPATILLTMGELAITDSVEIVGLGAELLTIDASGNDLTPDENNGDGSRVFNIDDGNANAIIEVGLSGITISGGDVKGEGGNIYSSEKLSIADSAITHGSVVPESFIANGGGIYSSGPLSLLSTSVSHNNAKSGGGIYFSPAPNGFAHKLVIAESVLAANHAEFNGGGVYALGSTQIVGSSLSSNSGHLEAGGLFWGTSENSNGRLEVFETTIFNNVSEGSGGGVLTVTDVENLDAPVPIFQRVDIVGNEAPHGGGMLVIGGVLLEETRVNRNRATRGGGLALINVGMHIIRRSQIRGNSATGFGGGISNGRGSTLVLEQSEVVANHSERDGGGISNSGDIKIQESIVANNSADESGGGLSGGGLIDIESSVLDSNTALLDGGGISIRSTRRFREQSFRLQNSTISRNEAFRDGGGISLDVTQFRENEAVALFENVTISGNTALNHGGGLYARGNTFLKHSTVTANLSGAGQLFGASGGGVFITDGIISLDHSLVAANRDSSGASPDIAGIVNSRFSLIGFGAEFLGPLADNGGPTLTHALLPGSPAINAGDPQANGIPEFDQRGNPFTRVSGRRIDIGAYEVQPLPGDFDGDGDADDFDLAQWEADFGITENSTSDSDGDGDTDGSDFLNWQRTLGVVQPNVENRSLAERTSETELRVAAVDLAMVADEMLNGPQFGRASVTDLDDTLDFAIDFTFPSPNESPKPVELAASRAAFEIGEVTAFEESAPDELDEKLSALDEWFAVL